MFSLPTGKRSRQGLVGAVLLGSVLAVVVIARTVTTTDSAPPPAHTPAQPAKIGIPAHLKIPKAHVDAPIEQVALTPDGAMDTPKDPADTAWYSPGPRPGEVGSSVIDGHFDRQGGAPAVFANLRSVQPGDKLSVSDEKGTTISFVVRELRTYDPNADAATVFRSTDGRAHLNLITCSGSWDTAQQSYSERLVVFTDREVRSD
jgi:LPXTG-site transpeptidase (sortase) family protein